MKSAAWILSTALLAASAWAQSPVPLASTPGTFDFRSEAVRQVVRDTAATHFAVVQYNPGKQVQPVSLRVAAALERPPEPATEKRPLPKPRRSPPPTDQSPFLSALVDILLDSGRDQIFGVEDIERGHWLACRPLDPEPNAPRQESCPAMVRAPATR